jgi:HEAT repeats
MLGGQNSFSFPCASMIYTMPRSLPSNKQWRILFAALVTCSLLLCMAGQASAQKGKARKPARTQQATGNGNTATTQATPPQPAKKNLAALRTGESPEGGRATITSDAPLNDYEAYRSGNRYYVVIPQASAPSVPGNARGRGFDDVQVHKRGNDTVLSFRLKPGTSAHVNQKFNRLEVVFNAPGDSTSGSQSGTANTSNTAAGNAVTGAGNTNQRTGATTAPGTTGQANANTGANATAPTVVPGANTSLANNGTGVAPPVAAGSPGSAVDATLPPVTPALGPSPENPANVAASPTPPADQVAQAQTAPSAPTSVVTTTTPATSGTSLGAVLRTNWLPILIAALVLVGIGLFFATRSRSRREATESELHITDKGPTAAALAEARPEKAEATVPGAAALAGGAVAAAVIEREAKAERTEPVIAATAMDETETVEAEAPVAFDVERVRLEIKHVLTGQPYDETVINSPVPEARQLIESELLFALSKRHTERRNRALKAFTEHGFFDDVTRELRTATVAVERAQAARKLGLTRDTASTPHLAAALEDTAPEVRRAAVEALTEVQDAEAIAPLEGLLKREEDRKVPYALIQRAIRASSVRLAEAEEKPATEPIASAPVAEATAEQPVIEEATATAEALPVAAEESAAPIAEAAAVEPVAASAIAEPLESATDAPAALAADETPTLEAEPATQAAETQPAPAEASSELSAGAIALAPAIVAGIATAEADAAERRRVEAEAARIHSEQEARRAEEERQRAEEESLRRVEEAARLRAEAERQRLAEEASRREEEQRRAEAERVRLEEERRAEEERERAAAERLRLEEEQRRVEEERRQAEEQERLEAERLRLEEERRAEEERARAAVEAERQREEERLRAEETRRAEEEQRRAEEERARAEEEQRRTEEERLRVEAETQRAAEEERRRAAEEKQRQEEEARQRLIAEERERVEEARRQRAEERERRRAEEERARLEAEERERSEADAARRRAEEAALRLAEMRRRMEEETRQREAAEAERLRLEEEERQRAEEEAARLQAEEEEAAARQQEEERSAEEERLRIEAETQRAEEERLEVEAEAERQREEARVFAEEERKRVEAEARQREEAEAARIQYEQESAARRLREEAETPLVEAEATEPVYAETTTPTIQADLFEATHAEPEPSMAPARATPTQAAPDWIEVDITGTEAELEEHAVSAPPVVVENAIVAEEAVAAEEEAVPVRLVEEYPAEPVVREVEPSVTERAITPADEDFSSVPGGILRRLGSESADERAAAVTDLARVGGDDAFREISAAFDDPSARVRDAAARALFDLHDDHAASFTRALREAPPERRRKIGNALASSGLASQAIGHLMGESREKTYDAFSLLFLMSKAGEVQPLMRAIEEHPNSEVRLAVVKLLALSGQQDILPAFRRLAVRGSLPTEVRSAVMEAIYQISSQASTDTSPVA